MQQRRSRSSKTITPDGFATVVTIGVTTSNSALVASGSKVVTIPANALCETIWLLPLSAVTRKLSKSSGSRHCYHGSTKVYWVVTTFEIDSNSEENEVVTEVVTTVAKLFIAVVTTFEFRCEIDSKGAVTLNGTTVTNLLKERLPQLLRHFLILPMKCCSNDCYNCGSNWIREF